MGCQKSKPGKKKEKKLVTKNSSAALKRFKIVLLGNSSVGKTSIATCYCMGALNKEYGPTIGGVYFTKECILESGQQLTVNIWDTAGEEKYRSMASLYYRDADVVMLVFDLTDPSSFKELEYWVGELDFRMEKNDLTVVVVGNKADKAGRAVPKPVIDNWISMYPEFKYTEVSAMTGMGVNRAFQLAAESLLFRRPRE